MTTAEYLAAVEARIAAKGFEVENTFGPIFNRSATKDSQGAMRSVSYDIEFSRTNDDGLTEAGTIVVVVEEWYARNRKPAQTVRKIHATTESRKLVGWPV